MFYDDWDLLTTCLPGNQSINPKRGQVLEMNKIHRNFLGTRKNTKGTRDPGHDKTKASRIPKTAFENKRPTF